MASSDKALEIGPLSDEVKKAAPQIRLVLSYLRQNATQEALAALCRKTSFSPISVKQSFCYNDQENFEDIRRIGRDAPIFKQLVDYLRKIKNESVIPAEVIPNDRLVKRLVADYHQWVKEQS